MKIYLKNWMKNISNDVDLFRLTIPGTHDCVTQYVQFSHISKTQETNIYQQLSMGIRALDIRVESNGDRLGMVHGIAKAFNVPAPASQMDMDDVLDHCYKFLDENPDEAIIFQFKNDSNEENEKCFNNLFFTYIQKNKDRWYTRNKIPTLGEARGKIVLIRRCKMYGSTPEFNDETTGLDFSRWVEQTTAEPEPLMLKTKSMDDAVFIIQDRFKYTPEKRWEECLKPFLDSMSAFNGIYIINYTSTAGGIKGPKNNSAYINPLLMEYPLDKEKYYGTIYLDFPHPDLTKKIISHNF